MFGVVYHFEIKAENKNAFVKSWLDMTNYLKQNRSALGSRLHQINSTTYFAYAQWPNKAAWLKNKSASSEESRLLSAEMDKHLLKSETIYFGEVLEDAFKME